MTDLINFMDEKQQKMSWDEFESPDEKLRFLEKSNSALVRIQNNLEQLIHFHSEMVFSNDIHYMLEKGLSKFQELVTTVACSVFLVNEKECEFVHKASIPNELSSAVQQEIDAQVQSGTLGGVINSGMPACVPTEVFKGAHKQPLSILVAPLSHKERTIGVVITVFEDDQDFIRQQTLQLLYILARYFPLAIQDDSLVNDLKSSYFDAILGVANSIEVHDSYTKGHSRRVGQIARLIAEELNWNSEKVEFIDWGGMLHDVGKKWIHDGILNKKGKLESDEFEKMKLHPTIGAQVIEGISFLEPVVPYILEHHERFNGQGYPQGLVGEQISMEGRLLAVADVFDAMTTERPYQKSREPEVAFKSIIEKSNVLYDPNIIDAFKKVWSRGNLQEIIPPKQFHEEM